MLSLKEASRVTGKDRGTIYRWIKSGKLSASKQDDGSVLIDPAELHRVCPYVVDDEAGSGRSNIVDVAVVEELATLRAENRLLKEMTEDLRKRLDAESSDRRRLSYLLEHQVEDAQESFRAPASVDTDKDDSSPGHAQEKRKWWTWR